VDHEEARPGGRSISEVRTITEAPDTERNLAKNKPSGKGEELGPTDGSDQELRNRDTACVPKNEGLSGTILLVSTWKCKKGAGDLGNETFGLGRRNLWETL